jgi:hypothetical protein
MDNKLVAINSFPNSKKKLKVLKQQISYLKKLGHPILLVSGCPIPNYIVSKLDYFILNTNNKGLDKHYTRYLLDHNYTQAAFSVLPLGGISADSFNPNSNNIITENIKLIANTAKNLGYKTVFYTEDDNIFKDESLPFIENTFIQLENDSYKIATILGKQSHSAFEMAFTTFFFFNVEFFNEIFTIPSKIEGWYDLENIKKYSLYKTYEAIFYDLLIPHLDKVLNIHDDFVGLVNQKHIDWGVFNRYQNEDFIIDNYFIVVPTWDNQKALILFNFSQNIEGGKEYNIKIFLDNMYLENPTLQSPGVYYWRYIPDDVSKVTLYISGYGEKIIDTSLESIKNNGFLAPYDIYWSN